MTTVSNFIIPAVIFLIVGFGFTAKDKCYESFLDGAKEGLKITVDILPTMIGLLFGVGILRASGLLELLCRMALPLTGRLGVPGELLPLFGVKLFSSSAALGLLLDIYKEFGADSTIGRIASLVMSSTETLFYTLSVYFLSVKVSKTRYTLAGALLSILAGTVASVMIGNMM